VIIAHHTGKERADDLSFMSARGGSAFAGWMDSGVKLSGTKPNVTYDSYERLFNELLDAEDKLMGEIEKRHGI
jgi:hypothetical protein